MKQIVIVKDSKTDLSIFSEYLVVKTQTQESVIAYRYIKEIYINKLINISIAKSIKLATIFDVYFIDQHGKVLAKVINYEKI
ncbi:MAG: hypothetical protein U9R50_07105 [Campylobacterota bacterium]|nr:hypothetical protein [Campylobacterota bacterium]